MLILTRFAGQSVQIGDDIKVVVLRSMGEGVRLGFIAPSDVNIVRTELLERLKGEEDDEV